jgi:transcriptional regulator with XRE-family HTH domain
MILDSIKLRKVREKAKLSQAELASLIDVSQATICEWEKKDHDVKFDYIMEISNRLGIPVDDLLKDGATVNINNQNNNKLDNGSTMGINVNIEAYQLQQDLIDSLKHNIELLKDENAKLNLKVNIQNKSYSVHYIPTHRQQYWKCLVKPTNR